ncbi:hypothetical protein EDC04DRAFT_2784460 [Pisolithus marmoratus]|nr:hypothetical protein EDC04DRAFT_2784460 [Pisolithus marmoratus]
MAFLYALAIYLRICEPSAWIPRTQLLPPQSPAYLAGDGRCATCVIGVMSLWNAVLLRIGTWRCVSQRASHFLPTTVSYCY